MDRGGAWGAPSHLNLPPGPSPKVVLLQMPFIKTLDLAFNKAAQNAGWDPSGTQGQRKGKQKGSPFYGFPPHHSQSSTLSLVVESGQCCGGSFFFPSATGLGHRNSPNLQFYPFVLYICLHLLFLANCFSPTASFPSFLFSFLNQHQPHDPRGWGEEGTGEVLG